MSGDATDYTEQPESAVVADAVRRAEQAQPTRDAVDGSLVLSHVRTDTVPRVLDLERFEGRPRRGQGTTITHTPDAFVEYVKRVGTSATTVWVDQARNLVTAVINDQEPGGAQGWRDLRVELHLQPDPEWAAWMEWCNSGETHPKEGTRLHKPVETAEFLEQYGRSVKDPSIGKLMEVAQTIHGTKTCKVEDVTDLHTGAVTLVVKETVEARAGVRSVKIPEKITLNLAPYYGFDAVDLDVMFRFRQLDDAGGLRLRFDPVRPDDVLRAVLTKAQETLKQGLGNTEVYLGQAPTARTVPTGSLLVGNGQQ